mgnify:CR=1 FL=1
MGGHRIPTTMGESTAYVFSATTIYIGYQLRILITMIGIISKMGQPSNKASNVSRLIYPPQECSTGREFGHTKNFIMALMLLLAGTVVYGDGPYGDVAFRRMGTHNGNLIATIF